MNQTFKPLGKRLVVKPYAKEERSEGGIIIPDQVEQRYSKGEVIDAGKDCLEVKKGDTVLYESQAGSDVEINKEVCRVISEDSVVAVISKLPTHAKKRWDGFPAPIL